MNCLWGHWGHVLSILLDLLWIVNLWALATSRLWLTFRGPAWFYWLSAFCSSSVNIPKNAKSAHKLHAKKMQEFHIYFAENSITKIPDDFSFTSALLPLWYKSMRHIDENHNSTTAALKKTIQFTNTSSMCKTWNNLTLCASCVFVYLGVVSSPHRPAVRSWVQSVQWWCHWRAGQAAPTSGNRWKRSSTRNPPSRPETQSLPELEERK